MIKLTFSMKYKIIMNLSWINQNMKSSISLNLVKLTYSKKDSIKISKIINKPFNYIKKMKIDPKLN